MPTLLSRTDSDAGPSLHSENELHWWADMLNTSVFAAGKNRNEILVSAFVMPREAVRISVVCYYTPACL